jgi:hypothetical protein
MLEESDGTRFLIAPTDEVAAFVSSTYSFDEVLRADVRVVGPQEPADTGAGHDRVVHVSAGDLQVRFTTGRRTALGWLLRSIPRSVAVHPRWLTAVDPVARRLVRGVQVRGSAGDGREEFYGATDVHRIDTVQATWRGSDLGRLAPVRPPVRFGFSGTPAGPCLVEVVTTIREGAR